jgi:hypothetical protein
VAVFNFFIGDDKVDIRTLDSPLLLTRFKRRKKTIDKKGEKAKVLLPVDAGLTVANVVW